MADKIHQNTLLMLNAIAMEFSTRAHADYNVDSLAIEVQNRASFVHFSRLQLSSIAARYEQGCAALRAPQVDVRPEKYLAELSPGNWVDTRQPLRVVKFVRHHLFMAGDLTTGENLDEILREHHGPYHVIEVRAWMNGFAETPVREVYYDRDIARARELQIVRLIDEAIASRG